MATDQTNKGFIEPSTALKPHQGEEKTFLYDFQNEKEQMKYRKKRQQQERATRQ